MPGGNIKGTAILENIYEVSLKDKHKFTIWSSSLSPNYLPKKNKNICPYKNLHMNAHDIITHNYPKVKIHRFINLWIVFLIYSYDEITLFSHVNKWSTDTYYNIGAT